MNCCFCRCSIRLSVPVWTAHVDQQSQRKILQKAIRPTCDAQTENDRRSDVVELQPSSPTRIERHLRSIVPHGRRGDHRNGQTIERAGNRGQQFGECQQQSQSVTQQGQLFGARARTLRGCLFEVAPLRASPRFIYLVWRCLTKKWCLHNFLQFNFIFFKFIPDQKLKFTNRSFLYCVKRHTKWPRSRILRYSRSYDLSFYFYTQHKCMLRHQSRRVCFFF